MNEEVINHPTGNPDPVPDGTTPEQQPPEGDQNTQPPEEEPPAPAPDETTTPDANQQPPEPNSNSGTPATTMEGGEQPLQPSVAGNNFDAQVTKAVEADTNVGIVGGVEVPPESEPILSVAFADEQDSHTFTSAYEKVRIDDRLSGGASVSLEITGRVEGVTHGIVRVRIIAATDGRVYLFRKDDGEAQETTFIASYTPHP